MKDFDVNCEITRKSDTTAAIAIASRRGLGKVRHIEVCQLWLQEKVRRGDIRVTKVGAHENVADALSNYFSCDIMCSHMRITGQRMIAGRHDLAPATEC